jgi:hypothetical protein
MHALTCAHVFWLPFYFSCSAHSLYVMDMTMLSVSIASCPQCSEGGTVKTVCSLPEYCLLPIYFRPTSFPWHAEKSP